MTADLVEHVTDPIITVHETRGLRSVQFWGTATLGKLEYPACMASMDEHGDGGAALSIYPQCPEEWFSRVARVFLAFRNGDLPEATHTVSWMGSEPTFAPVGAA